MLKKMRFLFSFFENLPLMAKSDLVDTVAYGREVISV